MIFALAEILRPEKLRQTNDLRALLGGFANELDPARKISIWLGATPHLNEPNARCAIRHCAT
jgi:hypothetical protein